MSTVAIVGGGPAGLSAGVFTSKNGLETALFDTGETWMSKAHLFNYLGIGSIGGDEFMGVARQQASDFGVAIHEDTAVSSVTTTEDGFTLATDDGEHEAEYVILATGADRSLAEELGCAMVDGVVDVDVSMETSVEDAYATGAMVRAEEWQAVISAGDGAAAALNVLSKERGEHFHDFDVPADAEAIFGEMD
ncbi:MAG: NAD(P)/FAD-dependent oxidoreductase [Salinarchaeum sp.]